MEYAPAKLHAARSIGISPQLALAVATMVIVAGLLVALATGGRWNTLTGSIGSGVANQAAGMGLRLAKLHVEGVSAMARTDIVRAAGLHENDPLLGVDLDQLRQRVERVGWVKQAKVVRLFPDTLVIAVSGRAPQAVWQHGGRMWVVDEAGDTIAEADPSRFPNLPLVVGDGANEAVGALLPLLRARPRIMARLDALVRFDNRRWDLRLKDGGIIALPAIGEESALIRLDQLDRSQRVLDLGLERIDLRQPDLIVVKPRQATTAVASAAPSEPAPVTPAAPSAAQPAPASPVVQATAPNSTQATATAAQRN